MTEKKKTVEECRVAYIESKREHDRLCARFEELKSAVDESHAVGSAAYDLRFELDKLGRELKEVLFEQAIASAPPIPVEAAVPTGAEVSAKVCETVGNSAVDYWK